MTTLQGYATTIVPVDEIVCAYASGAYEPAAYPTNAPNVVFGSFTIPVPISARLSVSACNSGPATLLVSLFADGVITSCQVYVTSGAEENFLTDFYDFVPGILYQLAAQYLGAASTASIRTVSLTS
jgi:hypothetical protein